jgi:DNA-binding NarL/FixJ family response regulator
MSRAALAKKTLAGSPQRSRTAVPSDHKGLTVAPIRVLIVDDHPLVRQGLRRIVEGQADIAVIGEVADGELAIEETKKLQPDVVLMDINLPSMNGLQATREIKHVSPTTKVINLTAFNNSEQQLHAIRSGASAYYPKEVAPDMLLKGIRLAHEGKYMVDDAVLTEKQLAHWLMEQLETISNENPGYPDEAYVPLSTREMEILRQIARGLSNKEIAQALGISRQTVKNHMTSILRKLAVNDRTQAALYALRHGWIRLEDTQ